MNSATAECLIPTMLDELENNTNTQKDLDNCYDHLVNFLIGETEASLSCKNKKRPKTKFKEYWDDELSAKWHAMCDSGKIYRNKRKQYHVGSKLVGKCMNEFRRCQRTFDKCLKVKKRSYLKGKLIEIERCNTLDPKAFWNYIKRIGPSQHKKIPWEVVIDGQIYTEKQTVLE